MAGSSRFEIDGVLNTSGIAKGAQDGAKALSSLEDAVGDVGQESAQAGGKVDSFASKLVDASRKAGKSDDDIKDALRGMGLSARQAENAVERVGDEFKETGRDGERAADKLEDSLRDVQQQSKRTADEVGDVGDKGFRKLGDAGEEVSGELKQNLGETFSSFRGDLEDLPQIAQDVFGGMASSAGGLPAALALAGGAAGIGVIINAFDQIKQAEEESKARVAEWAQAYVEAGGKVLSAATTTAIGLDIATDPERFSKAQENAKNWGVDVSVAIAAMAGETWALSAANDSLAETERKIAEEMENTGVQYPDLIDNLTETTLAASQGRSSLDQLTNEMQRGGEQADAYSRYLGQVAENTAGASTKVDEFGDKVTNLPDGTVIYIDAETGQATTDTDAIEKKIYGIQDKSVTVSALTSEAQRSIEALAAPRRTTVTVDVKQGAIAAAVRQYIK